MESEEKYRCHACDYELTMDVKIARRDTCDNCMADLHCCLNCRFHDPYAHNECREAIGTWVKEKETSNFCSSFEFKKSGEKVVDEQAAAKAKLAALFKL